MKTTLTITDLRNWLAIFAKDMETNKAYLTELDSAIGDADHGINMSRGMTAVTEKVGASTSATIADLFKTTGMTLVTSVGGASGPLYGTFFLRFGASVGAVTEVDGAGLSAALHAATEGVIARGKAEVGDKTMVDALTPALAGLDATLDATGGDIVAAVHAAAAGAQAGRDSTLPLVARKGRASYLGDRSAGHLDPGSASTAYLFEALAAAIDGE